MEEGLKKLVLKNYMEMLKREDKASIADFLNNPKALSSLLFALGASEQMMNLPAHREELEKCLKMIVKSTFSAIREGETDLEVRYLEHGIITNTESLKWQEKYRLEFGDNIYTFEVARNVGEVSKSIMANVEKGFIADQTKNSPKGVLGENSVVTKYLNLDKAGFVIGEAVQEKDKIRTIKRDGMKNFVDDDKKGIAWNGSSYELNEQRASATEFQTNMCDTISKYPETRSYYENIVGKEIVDKAVKILKTREENS